jgi:hypothetical protein
MKQKKVKMLKEMKMLGFLHGDFRDLKKEYMSLNKHERTKLTKKYNKGEF